MTTPTPTKSTCQICGRAIKSKSGTIAHHGYKRPGTGWQTSSCMGTHFRPYEVACDAIGKAIDTCQAHITRVAAAQAEFIASPPATLDRVRIDTWTKRPRVIATLPRPEGFDAQSQLNEGSYSDHTYEGQFVKRLWVYRHDIRGSRETLNYLQERLANWKAPE